MPRLCSPSCAGTVLGPLLAQRHGQRPSGVRRIESYAPEAVPALEATLGSHDRIGCARAVGAAVDLYRELRDAYPDVRRHPEAEHASLDYLADIETRFASAAVAARGVPGRHTPEPPEGVSPAGARCGCR